MAANTEFSLADPRANQVLQKLREELALTGPWRFLGPPIFVSFPVANVSIEVQHLAREMPDGWQLIEADCGIKRTPGKVWTKELAYLMSDANNSSATLCFGVLRTGVTNVDAS